MSKMIFTNNDVYKRKIGLEKAQLDNHIIGSSGHIEIADDVNCVEKTIVDPNSIYESSTNPRRDVYFGKGKHKDYPNDYVKVVVDFADPNYGLVVSAWTTDTVGTSIGRLKYEKPVSDEL